MHVLRDALPCVPIWDERKTIWQLQSIQSVIFLYMSLDLLSGIAPGYITAEDTEQGSHIGYIDLLVCYVQFVGSLIFKGTASGVFQKEKKRFLTKSKGCRIKKSATGPQCKPTRSKHGMVTRLTCYNRP